MSLSVDFSAMSTEYRAYSHTAITLPEIQIPNSQGQSDTFRVEELFYPFLRKTVVRIMSSDGTVLTGLLFSPGEYWLREQVKALPIPNRTLCVSVTYSGPFYGDIVNIVAKTTCKIFEDAAFFKHLIEEENKLKEKKEQKKTGIVNRESVTYSWCSLSRQ